LQIIKSANLFDVPVRYFAGFFGSSHFNSASSELCGLSFYQMATLQRKKKPKHNKETQISYLVFMSAKKSVR
jgi:hypothetical protein